MPFGEASGAAGPASLAAGFAFGSAVPQYLFHTSYSSFNSSSRACFTSGDNESTVSSGPFVPTFSSGTSLMAVSLNFRRSWAPRDDEMPLPTHSTMSSGLPRTNASCERLTCESS